MNESAPRVIDLGNMTVTLLDGGRLRLDGGAMFGIIPRPLWERQTPADERHRIPLACNCLLVEWRGERDRRVIIETGHGEKYGAKEQAIYAIDPGRWLVSGLARAGVEPESITDVIVTHLHFDHAGGLTRLGGDRVVPTFPNATVHVQRREYDDARCGLGIMTATYRDENLRPLEEAERWNLIEGEPEIAPGIRPLLTPGHTRGHQAVLIRGRDGTVVFPGDVMPTAAHVGAPYNMAYDLFPLDNRESKNRVLRQAANEGWLIVLDHEPNTPVMRAQIEKTWYGLVPAEEPGGVSQS